MPPRPPPSVYKGRRRAASRVDSETTRSQYSLPWSRGNNTALVAGAIVSLDGLNSTPVVWGTDRSLARRMVWQPANTVTTLLLSESYRGFAIEFSPTLELRLRWFDP